MPPRRRVQRIGAYALVTRGDLILLTQLHARTGGADRWTLPGGGVEHGEDPRQTVVREVQEETGLVVTVTAEVRVFSRHYVHGDARDEDFHAIRLVYRGMVALNSPEPRVVEVGGTTTAAAWVPLADVSDGRVNAVDLVHEVVAAMVPAVAQRLSAYALVRRRDDVLLTRISARGHHPGAWTLPGGGVRHGEPPAEAVAREVREETGLVVDVGALLDVHDVHFTGTAPTGVTEDFHGVHLVFAATSDSAAEPAVMEADGTTDAVAWVPVADVAAGVVEVLDVVRHALALPG